MMNDVNMNTEFKPTVDYAPLTGLPPRRFETARLFLRAIEAGDAKLIYDLYASDPVASKYMSFKSHTCIQDSEAFVEPAARNFRGEPSSTKEFVWVIHERSSGEPIGTVGFGPNSSFTLGG